jgi:hypothetical protein
MKPQTEGKTGYVRPSMTTSFTCHYHIFNSPDRQSIATFPHHNTDCHIFAVNLRANDQHIVQNAEITGFIGTNSMRKSRCH